MLFRIVHAVFAFAIVLPGSAAAQMRIQSPDIGEGVQMNIAQVLSACRIRGKDNGGNVPPALTWSGTPAGAKSFAVTMFDPKTGGKEFWHWVLFNIPAGVSSLDAGVVPQGAVEGVNDYGDKGYGGPCPPRGATHRYIFNIWALDVPSIDLSAEATGAQLKPRLQMHVLGKATLTARFEN